MARRERKKKRRHELTCLNARGPATLASDDIPLMFITHNDLKLMPSFLAHYRKLGVTRFICVDDVSTDGTRDYLPDEDGFVVNHDHIQRSKLRVETRLKLLSKWDPKRYGEKVQLADNEGGKLGLPPAIVVTFEGGSNG